MEKANIRPEVYSYTVNTIINFDTLEKGNKCDVQIVSK